MTNKIPAKALNIMALLRNAGARDVLIVGGFVRDTLLGIDSKDVDIEVYGMAIDDIMVALAPHFRLDVVGKSFGVIKIDNEIDVAIPRRESKIGMGHKDFKIEPDPNMSIKDAAARRDFTINSMAMRENGSIVDPFDGQSDLMPITPVLRATSMAFREDALRVLRGMQMAARFNATMCSMTAGLCQDMQPEFKALPKERIWEEWKKFAIKGQNAILGFTVLEDTGWLECFPELQAMVNVHQDAQWHPEGCVWTHTVLVVQEAIRIANREQLDDEDRMTLFFAALCHDMGKPSTTKFENGRWRARGHCEAGVPIAESFLTSIGAPLALIERAKKLIVDHLAHSAGVPTDRAVRRLAQRLHPTNINMLSMLIESDHSGRPPLQKGNPFIAWTEAARRLDLTAVQPKPILQGRHLIELGILPGIHMGEIIHKAFEAQLDGTFSDLDGAIQWFKNV